MFRHHSKRKSPPLNPKHELAVLLPIRPGMKRASSGDQKFDHLPVGRIRGIHLMWLFLIFGAGAFAAGAQTGTEQPSTVKTILAWTPLLLKGSSRFLTQFFRNSPWLVLLFYCMFMLPFEITIGELRIPFPDWIKAVIGLSLPVMANVAEIVRGAVNSIPSGQWEASESLAFTRLQQIWLIILPQCYKRMLPPQVISDRILFRSTQRRRLLGQRQTDQLLEKLRLAFNGDHRNVERDLVNEYTKRGFFYGTGKYRDIDI